ncbi:MAG: NAD(P)/FAD-dependent oxidoreductase [Desulfobacteraceae bacterium]
MAGYLIIGNGVAGTTAAEHIRKTDQGGKITMVTDEDLPFYHRLRLNDFVVGEVTEQALIVKDPQWYQDRGIDLSLRQRVIDADPVQKVVMTAHQQFPYDRLLLATGSHSFIPPIQGADKKGVFALRTIQDARDITAFARDIQDVVLIGGGLLGLEAGNALRRLGKRVTVVEFFPRLLPRQLDVDGAKRLQELMENMGFSFRLGAKTEAISGEEIVEGVVLEGGESISAQMVIISAGVRPNLQLAGPLGLAQDKGIQVNERLQTSRSHIYAAGDVAEFRGIPYGIWPAAMEQGKIAGTNMAGGDRVYEGTTMANVLKVVGIDLASAGNIDAENESASRVVQDKDVYKKIILEEDRITGCIMLGNTKGFNKITRAMSEGRGVSELHDLLTSEGFSDAAVEGE